MVQPRELPESATNPLHTPFTGAFAIQSAAIGTDFVRFGLLGVVRIVVIFGAFTSFTANRAESVTRRSDYFWKSAKPRGKRMLDYAFSPG
jgi:hypothetical protein